MSLFMGQTSQYTWGTVDAEKIKAAEIQFSATAATFNKMLRSCEKKCLNHEYGEGDLAKGEMECVDRCVAKYVAANKAVGENFQAKMMNPYFYMPDYDKVKSMMKQ
ncbi:mitochondrial import inner membrane translocase subunit Tim12p [Diutina catenulata]